MSLVVISRVPEGGSSMKTHLSSPKLAQRAPHEWNAALEDDEERETKRDVSA